METMMKRTIIGGVVGGLIGTGLFAIWAAHYGYCHGVSSRRDLTPGWETAGIMALYCTVMLGWIGCGIGTLVGSMIGFSLSVVKRLQRSIAT